MRLSLLLCACLFFADKLSAQKGRIVTGQILSSQNQSLENVTVAEKGTTNIVSADATGKYSIKLTKDNSTLVFSYVGFSTSEMVVGSASTLNPALTSNSNVMRW